MQNYLIIFVFFWISFCFCAFAWSEGTGGRGEGLAGEREGPEGGRGLDFSRETLIPSQFLTDLVPFPLDFPQENVPYLKENVRYLVF